MKWLAWRTNPWRTNWCVCLTAMLSLLGSGCGKNPESKPSAIAPPGISTVTEKPALDLARLASPGKAVDSRIHFTSMTEGSGVSMIYYGSPSPELYMTEQNGGGTALFDFDGDSQLDLFLTNGSHFRQPAESAEDSQKIYRSSGEFRFEDVTTLSRLTAYGFGMGASSADFDNDGFVDLFVAGYGRNRLWHNRGDGTFEETPLPPLAKETLWATSAAFADLNADGLLDLYVVNYVDWKQDDPPCYSEHQGHPVKISCGPIGRAGQPDALYQNLGDGHFENVALSAGIAIETEGKGLAVAIADLDGDRRLDVYVANDTTRNFLFHNAGKMTFREEGVLRGVAFSGDGIAGSSMGIACGDYNHDGQFDLFVTNFLNQTYDAYENLGDAGFRSVNTSLGLDTPSRSKLAFGVIMADFDLDGWPDLFVSNGHIWDLTSLGLAYEFQMSPYLFSNHDGKRFINVSQSAGDYFQQKWLGRSPAAGDLDQDGDTDLVVGHLLQPPAILRNDSERTSNSLRLKFIGVHSSRQPLGCRVELETDDGTTLTTTVTSGGSFQSSSDDLVILAIGKSQTVKEVRIFWPNGEVESWKQLQTGRLLRLIEGTGQRHSISIVGGKIVP